MYKCKKCGKEFENCRAIGGHSSWCGIKQGHPEEVIEKIKNNKLEYYKTHPGTNFGNRHTEESRKKMSERHYNVTGENNPNWKGGITDRYVYHHNIVYKKFGSTNCENCNISNEEYYKNRKKRRFDMHCTSIPKNYTIMEKKNWMCLCPKCHINIERECR